MKKTISGIMCGIIATGLLAGCVNVSESNPSEKKTQTTAKPDQTVLQERLYEAIKENDLESVKKLVAQGADITYADDFIGQNALHHAACFHSLEIFQWLLDQGMDIHATDKKGNTMLHLLFDSVGTGYYGKNVDTGECYCSHETKSKPEMILKMVKYLTDRKVNINAANCWNITSAYLAVCFGYLEIVKYLAEHGADLSNTLYLATITGQYDMVKYLVEQHGTDINEFDGEALMHASGTAVVRYLVEHGAKINIQDKWGRTPLHWHAERKNLETIKYLVSSGADIHCRTKEGSSVIHWAANHGRIQNVDFFLKSGLDINDRDNDGMTPLHYACKLYDWAKDKMAMIRYLVEHGADVNAHSFSRERARTPLHIAILQYDDGHAASYLLKHGAKVDEKDSRGQTALHYASKWICYESSRRLNAVNLLVSWNANVNAEDLAGMTPLHYAVGDLECVKYLVEHGANVNLRDKEGSTPLDLAEMHKHQEIVKYLKAHGAVSGKSLNGKGRQ